MACKRNPPELTEEDPVHKAYYEKAQKLAQQKPDVAFQILDTALGIARELHKPAWEYKDRLQQAFCHCNARRFKQADTIFLQLDSGKDAIDGQPELGVATLQVKGSCAHLKNDLETALDLYTSGIAHPHALPSQKVVMSLNASRVLGSLQRYNAALQKLNAVQQDVEQLNDPAMQFLFYYNAAHIYENIHDFSSALQYHFRAYRLPGASTPDRLSAAYQIGTQYSNRNIDSAVYYLRMVVDNKDDARPKTWRLGLSALVGWYNDHNLDSAATYLKRWEETGIDSTDSDYWIKKGRYLNALGQSTVGIPLLEKALTLYRAYENDDQEYGNDILADLVHARLKATAPPQHISDFEALLDSLNRQNNLIVAQEVERFQVQYETEKIEQHNQELRREKQWQQWLIAVLALAAVALGAWLYQTHHLSIANARRQTIEAENAALLEIQNQQLVEANAALLKKLSSQETPTNWAEEIISLADRQQSFLKTGDICYIQAGQGGVYWHTLDGGKIFIWQALKSCLQCLPAEHFVQISKSTIVARQQIVGHTTTLVRLRSGVELTVGEAYKKNLAGLM